MKSLALFVLALLVAAPAVSQPTYGPRRLEGPRIGVTILSPSAVEKINEAVGSESTCYYDGCVPDPNAPQISSSFPVVTQFGWQFERRMFQAESGLTGVAEWVLLAGGMERGMFLPSASFLAGLRTPSGLEVGVGPNLSLGGAAYAVAVGFNNDLGEVNLPVNAAVVFGQDGPRVSVLVGFTVSSSRY